MWKHIFFLCIVKNMCGNTKKNEISNITVLQKDKKRKNRFYIFEFFKIIFRYFFIDVRKRKNNQKIIIHNDFWKSNKYIL